MGHTPAVNKLVTLSTNAPDKTGQRPLQNWLPNGPWISGSTRERAQSLTQRPASVHSPKGPDGFRLPKGFSHTFRNRVYSECGTGFRLNGPIGNGTEFGSRLAPGAVPQDYLVPVDNPQLRQRAINMTLQRLADGKSQLGVALAERKKSISMISRRTSTIATSVYRFRKGLRQPWRLREVWRRQGRSPDWQQKLSRGTRQVAQDWLELQYGWSPLLGDIVGAVNHLYNRESHAPSLSFFARASAIERDSARGVYTGLPQWGGLVWGYEQGYTRRSTCRLDYFVSSPQARSSNQLGLTNPAAVVWELVPYSFILDWFIPIGPYLELLSVSQGISFRSGSISHKVNSYRNMDPRPTLTQQSGREWRITTTPVPGYAEQAYFRREVLTTLPTAKVVLAPHLSIKRAMNALALLRLNLKW